ncbi:MAG: cation diffusion facilitator family transporter [Candidatus Bathyarchaeia archaeon]|nr:cation transporter [Candidatus Bathyarchaeota archaeon]
MKCNIWISEEKSLIIVMLITSGIMILEIIGGLISNSLALLSDAWHMLSDLTALLICFIAGKLASKPPTKDKTYGYYRIEVLSALINGFLLVLIAAFIFREAFYRFIHKTEVKSLEMLTIAVIGLIANLISISFLSKHLLNLNIKAAFLHILGDSISSVGVIIGALTIFFTKWHIVDPIIGVIISVIIIYGTGKMLSTALHILLEGVPKHIDINKVKESLKSINGVIDVHDIHVWSITSYIHCFSAHLIVESWAIKESNIILNKLKQILKTKYGITHSTLQLEEEGYEEIGEIHNFQ